MTITIKYIVVNVSSAYNLLLGRPSLNRLGIVASTTHMKMKLPLAKGKVMEIKLKRTWRPINKIKKRWRHKWRTPMEVKVHLKGLQEACSKLRELEDIYFLFL